MSIRDIRLKWPEAEKKLATVGEIIVTRHSIPVARILPVEPAAVSPTAVSRRPRFDPAAHRRWLRTFWKGTQPRMSTHALLRRDRSM